LTDPWPDRASLNQGWGSTFISKAVGMTPLALSGGITSEMARLTQRPARIITVLSLGMILSQVAIMAVPAVIVDLASQWSLDTAQIGWLGGIYFAGYAAGLPFQLI
jgi:hypothetical protein